MYKMRKDGKRGDGSLCLNHLLYPVDDSRLLAYAVCVTLTTGIMLGERTTGILERFMICGISGIEILISHLVSLNIVMMFQVGTVLICVFIVYDINIQGSIVLVIFMTLLNAFCGMCFGFAISCTTYDERLATYMALGSFMPSFVLCGGFWPIEGMPDGLQQIAYAMPITNPTIALRSILLKGYGLEEFETIDKIWGANQLKWRRFLSANKEKGDKEALGVYSLYSLTCGALGDRRRNTFWKQLTVSSWSPPRLLG
uniref:ABC-2 type transporter transmembrane domain-containing protein n=2 Tax=Lutzomyia longipalpis TaxID=7200 RepID=A0A1B0C8W0_LUTLO